MPPKSRAKRAKMDNLEMAREKKRRLEESSRESSEVTAESLEVDGEFNISELLTMSESALEALDTDDDNVDPTFDIEDAVQSDSENLCEKFCEDFVLQLDADQRIGLGVFLTFQLEKHFQLGSTKAAELAGMMINRSDRSVRAWKTKFLETGELPDCKQGKYQRSGVLWSDESFNKKVTKYVRNNNNVKGKPNLTIYSFCTWINDDFLPNETLQPGFPRRISTETARKWLHQLGFEVLKKRRGHLWMDMSEKMLLSIAKNFSEK